MEPGHSQSSTAITATVMSVRMLFAAPRLTPAAVQRGFEWGANEARALLHQLDLAFTETRASENTASEDDEASSEGDAPAAEGPASEITASQNTVREASQLGTYSLGSMVLLATGDGAIEIYDGQQRTTTLTILLCVLRDLEEDPVRRADLHALVWQSEKAPRLKLSSSDQTLQRDAQNLGGTRRHQRINATLEVGKQIQRVKNTLRDALEGWSPARRADFANFVLENVLVMVQWPADARLARQMFVSTNLYGKRLDQLALLKGIIGDLATQQSEADAALANWTLARDRLGQGFERFLRAIDAIERVRLDEKGRAELQQDSWIVELGSHLERHYRQGKIVEWTEWLRDYSYAWDDLQRVLSEGGNETLEQNVFRLNAFPPEDWQALALFYWREIRREKQAGTFSDAVHRSFDALFARLHRRCMALTLGASSAARQQAFAKALWQAKCGVDPTVTVRDKSGELVIFAKTKLKIDRELTSQIKSEEVWIPLVRWLEMRRWRSGLPELMQEGSVEHVKSRNPDPQILASQPDYDRDCYALGNLAFITSKVNAMLENLPFADKRGALQREAQKYDLVQSVVATATFDANEIAARTLKLRDEVWDYLDIPPRPGAGRRRKTP